ncbi:pyruvate kinase [Paenibacillus physcomitrellae]|uniref:Pyruvate kinase n=1 Tax=Paenibacillus physcomitrellae TaxID=1619311 RepID=A0ABQ1FZ95_9BACL|nr:pyruvate kinase [Paenibacillus physcomitrellae]GGA32829.1 pyruvate kinase [Paenibacillus physcomitrellae]
MQKTKIICTLGPACDEPDVLKQMIQAGMTVGRLNMAHGELEDHARRIAGVRRAAEELKTFIPLMMDIKGPEIRIGKLKEASVMLEPGASITLTTEKIQGDAERVSVNYPDMPKVVKPGDRVLINDGLIELHIVKVDGTEMLAKVISGGPLKPTKGVNLPGVRTTLPGVTERDVRHIHFGLEQGIEMIAASFVRRGDDIREIRKILLEHDAGHIQIISKIENGEGIENLDDIIEASDGIMVARGDLGVEVPVEDVPMLQKEMIEKCNFAGKPVIVATHMLESMQVNPRPTRAEVGDVFNAVMQGADVVMLSGESAAGKYPVKAVQTMATVAKKAESVLNYQEQFNRKRMQHPSDITEVISQSAVNASLELKAEAIIVSTESGFTARMVSKYRPEAPIIAVTPQRHVLPQICLLSGVIPVLGDKVATTDDMFESAIRNAMATGYIHKGDTIVLSAGLPIMQAGTTNLVKVQKI